MVKGCNDSVRRHWGEINVMGEVSKPLYGPKWPMGPVLNSGFLSMKRLGVLLLPPGWEASPSQGYPQHIFWYPFVHLGEEEHCESKVSCQRIQPNDPGQGSNPDHLSLFVSVMSLTAFRSSPNNSAVTGFDGLQRCL